MSPSVCLYLVYPAAHESLEQLATSWNGNKLHKNDSNSFDNCPILTNRHWNFQNIYNRHTHIQNPLTIAQWITYAIKSCGFPMVAERAKKGQRIRRRRCSQTSAPISCPRQCTYNWKKDALLRHRIFKSNSSPLSKAGGMLLGQKLKINNALFLDLDSHLIFF